MGSREVKVGLFVLLGLLCIGIVIFLIGEDKQLFSSRVEYKTQFKDVQGLKPGAPVRMGGVNVGTVERLGYGSDLKDPVIYVYVSIVEREAARIRETTVASIAGKGLLGDKMLVLSVGDPSAPALAAGGVIRHDEPEDFMAILEDFGRIGKQAEGVVRNLEVTTQKLASEQFHGDMQKAMTSLANILEAVDKGDGYASRLIRDPKEADNISKALSNLEGVTRELEVAARGISQAVSQVNSGPGLAHSVLYGQEGTQALSQLGSAAGELATTLQAVREGDGLMKGVLFGGEGNQDLLTNLNAATGDLRQIMADLKAGKGTLGALLVDPSVYEDVKQILGNVERNEALRALVRYSIKQGEAPSVEAKDAK